ncbi:MAG: Mu-like prophage major head subunit gpT family protein, partial [Candidatus Brocadiae bacterium]|nr:Mu-like prophage major head subunit gpT family protein [Candidatus Brocadiia bacterium]
PAQPQKAQASAPGEDLILAVAEVAIQAAGAEGKRPRVSIVAYGGGEMLVSAWGAVVVDLAGLQLPGQVLLLADHHAGLPGIVGQGRAEVRRGQLLVEGHLTVATEAGQQLVALSKDGIEFQSSIGVRALTHKHVRAGDTVHVNERDLKAGPAGFSLIQTGRLKEVSLLPLGADESTTVSIAARKEGDMPEPEQLTGTEAVVAELRQAEASESARIAAVKKLCEKHPEIEAKAVAEGWSPEKAELEVLRASRPAPPNVTGGPAVPGRDILAAALILHAGLPAVAEKAYGQKVAEQAQDAGPLSLLDLCAAALRAEALPVPRQRNEMIRAAFSTTSLPIALGDAANKVLLAAYREAPATWASFAKAVDVNDFKTTHGLRVSAIGNMEPVPPDGEIKHGVLTEADIPFSVATFGKMLRVTRQTIINDDMGFLNDLTAAYGRMARRGLNDLVWGVVMANAGDFFSAANANLETGATSALDIDALAAAVLAMRKQRDADDNDLDIAPAVLSVPPELEVTARAILESIELQAASGDPMGNALKGIAKLEVEPRLSNTAKFTTASTTAWYLWASPQDAALIVAFLKGQREPTVENLGLQAEANTLGLSLRVYFDYGSSLGDHRAAVKSAGA